MKVSLPRKEGKRVLNGKLNLTIRGLGVKKRGLGRREGEQAAAAGRASTGEAGFRPGEPHAGVMAPRPLPTLDFVL